MRIESAKIRGYRLLDDISISFQGNNQETIIVGPNNSGKTSFVEIFYKFLSADRGNIFTLDDISSNQRKKLKLVAEKIEKDTGEKERYEEEFLESLPEISLQIKFSYNDGDSVLPLVDLIRTLDKDNNYAHLACRVFIDKQEKIFKEYIDYISSRNSVNSINESLDCDIFKFLQRRSNGLFKLEYAALNNEEVDYYKKGNDSVPGYEKIEYLAVKKAISCSFIYAQNKFDDTAKDVGHGLSKSFQKYYKTVVSNDDFDINSVEQGINSISKIHDEQYENIFGSIIGDLGKFGYNSNILPALKVVSSIRFDNFIDGNAKVMYSDEYGEFSESHNGLGYSNSSTLCCNYHFFWKTSEIPSR